MCIIIVLIEYSLCGSWSCIDEVNCYQHYACSVIWCQGPPCLGLSLLTLPVLKVEFSGTLIQYLSRWCPGAFRHQGLYSLSGQTSYRKSSWTPQSCEIRGLDLSNHSEIWQAPRQQGCQDACQISERHDYHNIQSRCFVIFGSKMSYCLVNKGTGHHQDINLVVWEQRRFWSSFRKDFMYLYMNSAQQGLIYIWM